MAKIDPPPFFEHTPGIIHVNAPVDTDEIDAAMETEVRHVKAWDFPAFGVHFVMKNGRGIVWALPSEIERDAKLSEISGLGIKTAKADYDAARAKHRKAPKPVEELQAAAEPEASERA